MPIRQSFSMVQPWRMQRWPTPTPAPMVHGTPSSTCTMVRSWMLERSPTVMGPRSPLSTHWYQTLVCAPSVTSPMTSALAATKAVGWTTGEAG